MYCKNEVMEAVSNIKIFVTFAEKSLQRKNFNKLAQLLLMFLGSSYFFYMEASSTDTPGKMTDTFCVFLLINTVICKVLSLSVKKYICLLIIMIFIYVIFCCKKFGKYKMWGIQPGLTIVQNVLSDKLLKKYIKKVSSTCSV